MFEEISASFYKHMKIMSRRPTEMADLVVHPFIGLLSLGILVYFVISQGGPVNSMMFVFVGVVAWNFYELTQRSMTYAIAFDMWSASLKHSFSTTSKIRHFIIGNAFFGLCTSLITFFLVGAVGIIAFGFNIFAGGIFLVNLISVFFFALFAGLFIDSFLVSKGEKHQALIWTMAGIVMVFSGVYYPTSILPSPLGEISWFLPTTHAIASMRAGFGFSPETGATEFALGFSLSIIYLAIGYFLFKRGLEKGYKNGIITQY